MSAEQEARDMLERIGVYQAQLFSAGEVVELANLIAGVRGFTREDVWLLRNYAAFESCKCKYHSGGLASLADRIMALLRPE